MTVDDLDRIDRAVINAFQGGFPIVSAPFESAALAMSEAGVDLSESELVDRTRRLADEGYISRFGPLINADAIGGRSTLVAMSVPTDRFKDVTAMVNDHPEVAHNYKRDHTLNMWFVISVANPNRIQSVLDRIEDQTGLDAYNLPKVDEFHLEALFQIKGPLQRGLDLRALGPDPEPRERDGITVRERSLIEAVQDGLPISEQPYQDIAMDLMEPPSWVRRTLTQLRAEGKIRRIGVVPHHYSLGYTENAMTVWDVPDTDVAAVGHAVGNYPFVTHCYERPRREPVWPYNVFAMVHGRTEAECRDRIEQVRETVLEYTEADELERDVLYSTRVLKKTGLQISERSRRAVNRSATD